jgi:hypothetical protein
VVIAAPSVACTPNLSDQPTAADILTQTDRWYVGSQGLANALSEDEALNDHVLSHICSGAHEWLLVAQRAYPSNYAHLNEELSSALAVALVASPDEVLRAFGTDVCHMPDHLPASCETIDWPGRVRAALERSSDHAEAQSRAECIAMVTAKDVQ